MNVTRYARLVTTGCLLAGLAQPLPAQLLGKGTPEGGAKVAKLESLPATITVEAGQKLPLRITAYDAAGRQVDALIRVTGPRGKLTVEDSILTGVEAGSFELFASVFTGLDTPGATLRIPVKVNWPAVAKVEIGAEPGRLFQGVTLSHWAKARHASGSIRPNAAVSWSSSNASVATVDRFGNVSGQRPGVVSITATIENTRGERKYTVVPSPVRSIDLTVSSAAVRTGDVVHVTAVAKDRAGGVVKDAPITWSYVYTPDDSIRAQGGAGDIREGMFAADYAGVYTILAVSGQTSTKKSVDVRPRDVVQNVKLEGRGAIRDVHTLDLWPFAGKDGRDYALVGTWGGNGIAYIFDITDPSMTTIADSVQIDARAINDVMVSPDARYGVLSREGASNRVNGLVILDLENPSHPTIASRFDEDLTGGVHNLFATNDYLFAISNGDKYVIIDVKDITKPRRVGEYNHPNSRVHDLWVRDGIAYSSEWGTGVVAVDVGNGTYGGSPEKPVLIGTYPTTSGNTHEVYPYFQKSTGKLYIFLGDEVMSRRGRGAWQGTTYDLTERGGVPQTLGGYTHIIDFTDPRNPKNVARYEHPEFGTHDIIVENDILYQAYYDGGVRMVDVSGELMGNLARQQREIAVFKPFDPKGYTPNAPMVMNAMPYKGRIFFTDFNSGLWSVKLEPRTPPVP